MKAITQVGATFQMQSYFSSTLLQGAILAQSNGNPIVDTTKQYAQIPGRALALHPASQSPVAIVCKGGAADSAIVHLTPGQKIVTGTFKSFDWGLPFGWLGGGPVILYVLDGDADVSFPSVNSAIVFHRQRMAIVNGNNVAAPGTPNWPLAFPWSNATRGIVAGVGPTPQQASPLFAIVPDIVQLQLVNNLAAPADLLMQITNDDGFDLNSTPDQAVGYDNGTHFWPITFQATVAGVNPAAVAWLPPEIAALGGDAAAVTILDPAGALGGQFVDVVRFGRFM